MGDIVGDFLEAVHQRLDPLQHGIEVFREAIEFVAAAPDRQASGEVAGHDALGGAGHGVDPLQHPPRHEDAAADAEHDDDQQRPLRGLGDDAEQPPPFLQVAADQQAETVGEFGDAHQRAVIGRVLLVEPAIGGFRPADRRHHARRQRADIAANRLSGRRGDEIEIGAGPQRAVADVKTRPRKPRRV